MTNDELIRMAKEAGLPRWYQTDEVVNMDLLGRFAALVRADERNRTWTQEHWTEYERSIAAASEAKEREACAFDADWCIQNHLEHLIAERIRARGNT